MFKLPPPSPPYTQHDCATFAYLDGNLNMLYDVDVSACEAACDANTDCIGFKYYTPSAMRRRASSDTRRALTHTLTSCLLKHSSVTQPVQCSASYSAYSMYLKPGVASECELSCPSPPSPKPSPPPPSPKPLPPPPLPPPSPPPLTPPPPPSTPPPPSPPPPPPSPPPPPPSPSPPPPPPSPSPPPPPPSPTTAAPTATP